MHLAGLAHAGQCNHSEQHGPIMRRASAIRLRILMTAEARKASHK
jgi:hypothetical protein